MKKSLLLTLISSMVVLSACSKESEFKSAITKNMQNQYACLNYNMSQFITFENSPEIEKYRKENLLVFVTKVKNGKLISSVPSERARNEVNALVNAGLLTKTTKTQPATDWNNKPLSDTQQVIELYNLTDAGKKTIVKQHGAVEDYNATFCYAHPKLENIINFTEEGIDGQKFVEVKYSYKYIDIADWANNPEIQKDFPQIKNTLNKANTPAMLVLMKTHNGWQTQL